MPRLPLRAFRLASALLAAVAAGCVYAPFGKLPSFKTAADRPKAGNLSLKAGNLSLKAGVKFEDGALTPPSNVTYSGPGTPTPAPVPDCYSIKGGEGSPGGTMSLRQSGCDAITPSAFRFDAAGNLLHVVTDAKDFFSRPIKLFSATGGTFFGQNVPAKLATTILGGGEASPSSEFAPTSAKLKVPFGIDLTADGDLLLVDHHGYAVYLLAAKDGVRVGRNVTVGKAYVLAGEFGAGAPNATPNDVDATGSVLYNPIVAVIDDGGDLVIGGETLGLRVVAGSSHTAYGKSMTKGRIYSLSAVPEVWTMHKISGGEILMGGQAVNQHDPTLYRFKPDGTATQVWSASMGNDSDVVGGVVQDSVGHIYFKLVLSKRVMVLPAQDDTIFGVPVTEGKVALIAGGATTSVDATDALKQTLSGDAHTLQLDASENLILASQATIIKVYR